MPTAPTQRLEKMRFPPSTSWPLVLGTLSSAAVLAICSLTFFDDILGFRQPEAFASLLAAGFSGIATVWLIVTVVWQGQELRLQREQLKAQQDDTRRMAAAAELQNSISAKREIFQSVQSCVSQYPTSVVFSICNSIAIMIKNSPEFHEKEINKISFDIDCIRIELKNLSSVWISWESILDISNLQQRSLFQALMALANEAVEQGVWGWWLNVMVWNVKPSSITDVGRNGGERDGVPEQRELRTLLIAALKAVKE